MATEGDQESSKANLRKYLNKRLKIALSDGRFVTGDLLCTDKDMNLVLGNCEELIPKAKTEGNSQYGYLGHVVVYGMCYLLCILVLVL